MPIKSNYVVQTTTKSKCLHCDKHVDLLCHEWAGPKRERAFYICFECKRIYEVGRGEVRREKVE
jgi:DNA-directed RNA polymerase subunit RPC12/RpoP